VQRAGGATRRAELGGLNLAATLEDGRQVLVPERVPAGGAAPAAGATAAAPAPAPGQPLNLNTATLEQLDTLSGIGPLTAQKILDFREERGAFSSIEELGEIPGIGDKRLASLREEVTL
jgi:competence protein ComEA